MSVRPKFTRTKDKERGGSFSTGKYAVGICHRSGFKVPYRRLKFEPGTNYLVDVDENDGIHSLVANSLNFTPEKKIERIALRWSFPDTPMSIGTIVSADQLYLPAHALSVDGQFIIFATELVPSSVGTGVSSPPVGGGTPAMVFTSSGNSMYYIILFSGI